MQQELPMTLTEKIFSRKLGRNVAPGEIVECPVDFAVFPEGSFKMAMDALAELGKSVLNPDKVAVIFDHYCPPSTIQTAELQAAARRLAKRSKIKNFFDCGEGICHQVFCEQGLARPGNVIVGGDSHTATYGAFGAFSTGMGATDMAIILATGKTWFKIPETYKVEFKIKSESRRVIESESPKVVGSMRTIKVRKTQSNPQIARASSSRDSIDSKTPRLDRLPKGIYAKDLALAMLKEIGADGAIYKALEFESELLSDDTRTECDNCSPLGELKSHSARTKHAEHAKNTERGSD